MSWSRATITPEGQESQTPPATAPDDAALVAAAQVDPTAFAPLYARYLPPVYRYCYRRLETSAAAEDATSEIFVKVLAALPRYRAGSFRALENGTDQSYPNGLTLNVFKPIADERGKATLVAS